MVIVKLYVLLICFYVLLIVKVELYVPLKVIVGYMF